MHEITREGGMKRRLQCTMTNLFFPNVRRIFHLVTEESHAALNLIEKCEQSTMKVVAPRLGEIILDSAVAVF